VKTVTIALDNVDVELQTAKDLADAIASVLLEDMTCLSWFDREENQEAPAHVSECHDDSCETPGYLDYALSRGAELKVDIGNGAYVFLYRSVAEFTDMT
jgi:hypothetical protein